MDESTEKRLAELEKQLLSKIALYSARKRNAVQFEKVDRYLYLVRKLYEMREIIDQESLVISVENGAQRYVKAHPLLKEMYAVYSQLLALERSFDFEVEESPVEKEGKGSDLL